MKHIFYVLGIIIFAFAYLVITSLILEGLIAGEPLSSRVATLNLYQSANCSSFFLGLIPAFIAKSKGRNFYIWWIYGYVIFIIALIHSFTLKITEKQQLSNGMKKCPFCAELIKEEAVVCRYCGNKVEI